MSHIFISYATEDHAQAKAVHDGLEAAGLDCWIAPDDIPAGANWPVTIDEAILRSGVFVLVFSKSANASETVEWELSLARDNKIPVLPFFLEEIKPAPGFARHLHRIQQLHAFRMSPEESLQALRKSIRRLQEPVSPTEVLPAPPPDDRTTSPPPSQHLAAAVRDIVSPAPAQIPEGLWAILLASIAEGQVVPIVGPELLEVEIEGRQMQFYSYLAERLAEHLEIPSDGLPSTGALREVSGRWLARGGELPALYAALGRVFLQCDPGVPKPLRQLAKILPLKLFITTCFDPLLERALNEERFGGDSKTRILAYSPMKAQDLNQRLDALDAPLVFHLFGRMPALPSYAVTEEDTQEFVQSLESERRRTSRLFAELARRRVLLLGVDLPDWIARSFLRLIQGGSRLGRSGILIADDHLSSDPGFLAYLQRSNAPPWIFQEGGAIELVDQLYRRWEEYRPAGGGELAVQPPPHAIYISFPEENRDVVEGLVDALRAAGLRVWREPNPAIGERSDATIRHNIERCSLFIPILSRQALTPQQRFFQLEWRYALESAQMRRRSLPFIVPLAIDDVSPGNPALPGQFSMFIWLKMEDGRIDSQLVGHLKLLYRDYQLALKEEP